MQKYGLITIADNKYCVASFDEYALDNKIARSRKQNNERQKRFAEKQKDTMGADAATEG